MNLNTSTPTLTPTPEVTQSKWQMKVQHLHTRLKEMMHEPKYYPFFIALVLLLLIGIGNTVYSVLTPPKITTNNEKILVDDKSSFTHKRVELAIDTGSYQGESISGVQIIVKITGASADSMSFEPHENPSMIEGYKSFDSKPVGVNFTYLFITPPDQKYVISGNKLTLGELVLPKNRRVSVEIIPAQTMMIRRDTQLNLLEQ